MLVALLEKLTSKQMMTVIKVTEFIAHRVFILFFYPANPLSQNYQSL
jgi:hypothetical protein